MVRGLKTKWGTCSRTVSFDHTPQALACWKEFIAVRLNSGDIIILDAITGTRKSVFSSHTNGENEKVEDEINDGMDDDVDDDMDELGNGVGDVLDNEVDNKLDGGMDNEMDDRMDVEIDDGMSYEMEDGMDVEMDDGTDDELDDELDDGEYDASDEVNNLAFSPDGSFLVSGGDGNTVKLWDIQTGGVVTVFCGHTKPVLSVSVSPDCTMIASGSRDHTIRLWSTHTGECHHIIKGHSEDVYSVSFSPTNSQLLMSASSDCTIRQWDADGYSLGPGYEGNSFTFSSDGNYFVSWEFKRSVATVQDSHSGEVITELESPIGGFQHCCLSPDGKFMAGGVGNAIYVWDITSSDPHLVEAYTGHTSEILTLAFSSSLISSS